MLFPNAVLFHKPLIFRQFDGLVAVETTRHGGLSQAPFSSLNLGRSSGDAPENVVENKRRLCEKLGIETAQLVTGHQTHGDQILTAKTAGDFPDFDAKITASPNLFLTVTVADCTPILVFDKRTRAVAAIHAGWRGTTLEIVRKTLERMKNEFGTAAIDCFAYVGTCIGDCEFEVGEEVADQFSIDFKTWNTERGKFFVDLKAANRAQLLAFGLPENQIEVSRFSTVENNDDFFSYRKESGKTGRFWNLIGILDN